MRRHTRNLFAALAGASALTLLAGAPSFALDLPTPIKMDMGPFGEWDINGGLEAALSGWNNASGTTNGNGAAGGPAGAQTHGGDVTGDIDLTNAIFILNSKNKMFGDTLPLQFHAWIGEPPQTPVIGYTSVNVSPNLFSSLGFHGRNNTGAASFCFKCWGTYAPFDWFSFEGGVLPSVDGTEIGVGFLNPLPFLSDLNNMQTTVAEGVQFNFIAPPDKAFYGLIPGYASTLTIRIADGYKTGNGVNELGFTGLWNLTPDGSSFIVGYGHTRLSVVGGGKDATAVGPGLNNTNPFAVGNFGSWNSNLVGVGTVYNLTNRLLLNAEVETQWLPQDDIPTALRCTAATCGGNTNQDYYRWSTQVTLAYDFGIQHWFGLPIRYGWAAQPSFTYQHGNTSDPNGNAFGNYLGLGVSGPGNSGILPGNLGTFGPGSKMYGFQFGPSFQFHNFFVRPTFEWTHLASVDPGFAYGNNGNDHDQIVLMLDFGFLLGQFEKTDTGQP